MRRLHLIAEPITVNATGLVAAAHTVANTPMTLVTASMPQPSKQTFATANPVTLTSAANLAGSVTITGLDRSGNKIQEVITSPQSNTIATAALFSSVTSITPSFTDGTNTMSAGWGAINYSPWLCVGYRRASLIAKVLSAGNYQVMATSQNILDPYANTGLEPNANSGLITPNAPYQQGTSLWPLLLGSVNSPIYEDDGTYSGGEYLGDDFTSATPGVSTRSSDFVQSGLEGLFAFRVVVTTAAVQLDVSPTHGR